MKVFIDFETRSKVDLKKCGAYRYAMDGSTEVLCCAFRVDDGPTSIVINRSVLGGRERVAIVNAISKKRGIPEKSFADLEAAVAKADEVHAFNANFERIIWKHVISARWPIDDVPLEKWRCTMARALASGCPGSLKAAGHALKLKTLKQPRGALLIGRLCKPKRDGSWGVRCADFVDLYEYCMQDVDAEYAIHKSTRPLRPEEVLVWQCDQRMNDRGVHYDAAVARDAVALVEAEKLELCEELDRITNGKVTWFSQVGRILEYLAAEGVQVPTKINAKGVETPTLDKAACDAMVEAPHITDEARRVVEIRQECSKSSAAKFTKMTECQVGGYLRGLHQYHGAHTGRWAGRLIQPQNLPRDSYVDDEFEAVMSCYRTQGWKKTVETYGAAAHVASKLLRGTLCAPEGHSFLVADYSQIEARAVAWLAGEDWKVRAFRDADEGLTRDIYCVSYANTFGMAPDDVTPDQRFIGKVMELAFGYQGGVGAWRKMAFGAAAEKSDAEVQELVYAWRNAHPNIASLWSSVDVAARRACDNHGTSYEYGPISFFHDTQALYCTLPSGRQIVYREAYVKERVAPWGVSAQVHFMGTDDRGQWAEKHSYGGKWVENIVQGLCRDLLAEAMVRLDDEYPTVISVHDELGTYIADDEITEATVTDYENALCVLPHWATGLPLAASGWVGKRYRK